jgi:hypothetical protein
MKQQKNANLIYPTCIVLNNKKYRESLPISNVFYGTVLIWPWGYEN